MRIPHFTGTGKIIHQSLRDGLLEPAVDGGSSIRIVTDQGHVDIPNSPSLAIIGPVTLDAWVNLASNWEYQQIVEKYDVEHFKGYGLRTIGQRLFGFVMDADDWTYTSGSTAITLGEWHHVAMTADGDQIKVYVDGALDGSTPSQRLPTAGSASLKIGANGDRGQSRFDGSIAEVAIYDQALSADRIQTHYLARGVPMPSTGGVPNASPDAVPADQDKPPRISPGAGVPPATDAEVEASEAQLADIASRTREMHINCQDPIDTQLCHESLVMILRGNAGPGIEPSLYFTTEAATCSPLKLYIFSMDATDLGKPLDSTTNIIEAGQSDWLDSGGETTGPINLPYEPGRDVGVVIMAQGQRGGVCNDDPKGTLIAWGGTAVIHDAQYVFEPFERVIALQQYLNAPGGGEISPEDAMVIAIGCTVERAVTSDHTCPSGAFSSDPANGGHSKPFFDESVEPEL